MRPGWRPARTSRPKPSASDCCRRPAIATFAKQHERDHASSGASLGLSDRANLRKAQTQAATELLDHWDKPARLFPAVAMPRPCFVIHKGRSPVDAQRDPGFELWLS